MTERFPPLPEGTVEALNILGSWLAQDDINQMTVDTDFDVIVLAGNAVIPTIDKAFALAQKKQIPLLITGGVGHSTEYLYTAIRNHPQYGRILIDQQSEAELLAEIAERFWQIDRRKILLETQSTNCGENAQFSLICLADNGLSPERGLLIQDPTMQRRTQATFERVWQKANLPQVWSSWSPVKPKLALYNDGVGFATPEPGLWRVDRYMALICGELPRILDNKHGYGPLGRGYMVHVDIPDKVRLAWGSVANNKEIHSILAARAIL